MDSYALYLENLELKRQVSIFQADKVRAENKLIENECTICAMPFDEISQYKRADIHIEGLELQCDHDKFHTECLYTWLKSKGKCPICVKDSK